MAIQIGDKAPEVLGLDQNGKEIKLSDFKARSWRSISTRKTIPAVVQLKRAVCGMATRNCKLLATK